MLRQDLWPLQARGAVNQGIDRKSLGKSERWAPFASLLSMGVITTPLIGRT